MTQSYSNSGGSGNRTLTINATTTATLLLGTTSTWIDGSQANTSWWQSGTSGREVRFDFGRARLVTEATWYQDIVSTHGTWQWQGSADGSSWTSIGSTFTLGSPATQVITTLSGNATSYRYYRMLQTAGTTSSGPFLRETEFLIDDTADPTPTKTVWSSTDKSASVTISGLGQATTGTSTGGGRTVDSVRTGKYYWEVTGTSWTASATGIGGATAGAALNLSPTSVGTIYLNAAGSIQLDGNIVSGAAMGARTTGDIIGFALDMDAKLIWIRVCPSGPWNGNAANSPGGAGGISLVPSFGVSSFYPAAFFQTAGIFTANFGDGGSFSGALPSGFTSGFPIGAGSNIGAATQIVSEQWINFNAQAQLTQLILEEWAAFPPPPYQVTLAAIEEWTLSGSGVRAPFWVTQTALEEWTVLPPPPLWVTQVAIEHWTTAATLPTSVIVTQAAIEHWIGETATVPTGIMGPMITTIF